MEFLWMKPLRHRDGCNEWTQHRVRLRLKEISQNVLTSVAMILTLCREGAEHTQWTLVRPIHGLAGQWVQHVNAVLPDQVTFTVRLGRESHRATGTFEWLLACM